MTAKWNRDVGAIPNRVGARISVYLSDGTSRDTVVEIDGDGLHVLRGVVIARVTGWRYTDDVPEGPFAQRVCDVCGYIVKRRRGNLKLISSVERAVERLLVRHMRRHLVAS